MKLKQEFLPGNRVSLLNSGGEYFPELFAEIEMAKDEVFLEAYIFANDPVGQSIAAALCRAAERGVRVRVLVDGFGARNFGEDFLPRMAASGVQAMYYRPELALFKLRRHRLRRLHRKLAVIDGRVGFVGGINIVDDYNAPENMCPRYDYAVRVEGPVLGQIHHAVRHMWEVVVWANFKRRFRLQHPLPPRVAPVGTQWALFLRRDNILHRNDILNAYLTAIQEARQEILIANAYFLPGVRFGQALLAAARRGVRITLLVQGQTDHRLMQYATQTLYEAALKAGMRVLEYHKSFMHAKVAVIDGEWATVGSSNIDPFSLLLAKEGNIVVRDKAFASQLTGSIHDAMATGATEMKLDSLDALPLHSRFLRWLSYGLVRVLVGFAGYGPRHWQADEDQPGITPP